jgi:hypothetical protein
MKELAPAAFDAAIRMELRDVPAAQIDVALPIVLGLNPNRTPEAIAAAVRAYNVEGRHRVLMADEVAEAVANAEPKAAEAGPEAPDLLDGEQPRPQAAAAPAQDGSWIVQPDPGVQHPDKRPGETP